MLKGVCPTCGSQFDIAAAINDADGRRFVNLLRSVPGPLVKPLKSHGYLLTVMAAACEKVAARVERQVIERHRYAPEPRLSDDELSDERGDHRQGFKSIREVMSGNG